MEYLVSVLYMSLFDPEEYNRMVKPVTVNKTTGDIINKHTEDIRTVIVDKDRLNHIVRNGFSFRFINERDSITLYKEILDLIGDKEISEEIRKALNVTRETNYDRYIDLKLWLEEKYGNVLKEHFNNSISGRRNNALRKTNRKAFGIRKDISVDEQYVNNF